jgi:hypothetical protein
VSIVSVTLAQWLRHGEAVAIGVALDSRYCVEAGLLDAEVNERIVRLLVQLGFRLYELALGGPSTKVAASDQVVLCVCPECGSAGQHAEEGLLADPASRANESAERPLDAGTTRASKRLDLTLSASKHVRSTPTAARWASARP